MEKEEVLLKSREIAAKYGLDANLFESKPRYGINENFPSVVLFAEPSPGFDTVRKVVSEIENQLPVSRVVFNIKSKD